MHIFALLLCHFFYLAVNIFRSLDCRCGVVRLELCHKVAKGLDALHGHGVVETGTDSADRAMPLKIDKVGCSRLREELGLEGLVLAHAEGNIDTRAVLDLNVVDIVSVTAVDVVVECAAALNSPLLQNRDATLLDHVAEVEAADIDGPAGRGVLERVRCL